MSDRQSKTKTQQIIENSGEVRGDLPWPARWIVQLIQRMIAIMIVTMGNALEAIFKGEKPKKRSQE